MNGRYTNCVLHITPVFAFMMLKNGQLSMEVF